MTLVLTTSRGDPTTTAANPANEALARWQGVPSFTMLYFKSTSLNWSYVANSAAVITQLRKTFGPQPVHRLMIPPYLINCL